MPNPNLTSCWPNVRASLAAPLLLLLVGCVTTSESDGGTRFHYEYWLPISIFFGGLVCVPIGFLWRKSDARLGWALMLIGPLAALGLAPTYVLEGTFVDDKGFEARIGFWGLHKKAAAFDALERIRVVDEEIQRRRSTRVYEVLYFDLKTGENVSLTLSNELNIQAGKQIFKKAGERGIPIVEKK